MEATKTNIPAPTSLWKYLVFTLAYLPVVSILLGEFFYGSPASMFIFVSCVIAGSSGLFLLMSLISAQSAFFGSLGKNLFDLFVIFPWLLIRPGLPRLLREKPFRAGLGTAFFLSAVIIMSWSSYLYWPRITSKFDLSRKLTKKEQAWEDHRNIKKMLKFYKQKYKRYPQTGKLLESLQDLSQKDERVALRLKRMTVKSHKNKLYLVDPWNTPYLYYRYKKWKVVNSYKFYSHHVPSMK